MRKFSFIPLVLIAVLLSFSSPLLISPSHPNGIPEKRIVPVPRPDGNLLFGQKHAYTVVFRNDGASTVLSRIVFKNTEKEAVKQLVLTIPDVEISDATFFQVTGPKQCIEYFSAPTTQAECLRYNLDHLYTNFEYFGNEEYTKLSPGRDGQTLTIALANPVNENEAGGIVFAYRTRGYTKENWAGAYRFTFTSPQVKSSVALVRVAIGVDSDLFLKGSKSKVAYREEVAAPADLSATSIGGAIDYYQQAGFTKEGRNLGSGESLVVKGTYANTWWKLYPGEMLAAIGGLLLFIFLWLLWQRFYRREKQTAGPFTGIFTPKNVGVALVSALATFGLTYLVKTFQTNWGYGDPVSSLLFSVVSLGLYGAVLFGPAVLVAFSAAHQSRAEAWRHFLFIVFVELLFLAILLVVYVNVVPPDGIRPLPYEIPSVRPQQYLEG